MAGGGLLRNWAGKGGRQRFSNFDIQISGFGFWVLGFGFQSDREPLDKSGSE